MVSIVLFVVVVILGRVYLYYRDNISIVVWFGEGSEIGRYLVYVFSLKVVVFVFRIIVCGIESGFLFLFF